MDDIINGCYGLGERDTDYKLTEGLLDALPTLYQQDEQIYEYNQGGQSWSKKSCTIFSAIGAISDLFNVEIPLDTIKAWDNDSYNHGRKKGEGWWVGLAVEFIADKRNASNFAKKHGKVAFYSFDLKDNELLKKILEKRYTICTGYDGNANYNNDKNADGVLDGVEFGNPTYGHAISVIRSEKNPTRVKDNYYGIKYNKYEVAHELSQIPCFFSRGFIYTKVAEDALEEVKRLNELRTKVELAITTNSEIWKLVNDKNYQNKLHDMNEANRKKLKTIEELLTKYM